MGGRLISWGNYWQLRVPVKHVPCWFDSSRESMKKLIRWTKWWSRWWVRYFPVLAYRRITCKHDQRYDGGGPCLHCASPWFWYER